MATPPPCLRLAPGLVALLFVALAVAGAAADPPPAAPPCELLFAWDLPSLFHRHQPTTEETKEAAPREEQGEVATPPSPTPAPPTPAAPATAGPPSAPTASPQAPTATPPAPPVGVAPGAPLGAVQPLAIEPPAVEQPHPPAGPAAAPPQPAPTAPATPPPIPPPPPAIATPSAPLLPLPATQPPGGAPPRLTPPPTPQPPTLRPSPLPSLTPPPLATPKVEQPPAAPAPLPTAPPRVSSAPPPAATPAATPATPATPVVPGVEATPVVPAPPAASAPQPGGEPAAHSHRPPRDGAELAQWLYNRATGRDSVATVEMVLTSSSGHERVRRFESRMVRHDTLQDSLIRFTYPRDIDATAFLTREREGDDAEQFLYLPALRRARRIVAKQRGKSFVNSDLYYQDLDRRRPDQDRHRLLGEAKVGPYLCWILESIPVDPESSVYGKSVTWIDQATLMPVQGESFDRKEKKIKENRVLRLAEVQGIWTAMESEVTTIDPHHTTRLKVGEIRYNVGLKAADFNERALQP